jgi:hypothetical protein
MTSPSGTAVQAPPAPKNGKAPVIIRPFVAGTRRVDKQTYDQTKTLTAATQTLPTYECDPNGFLEGLYILVEAVAAGNSATVAFNADAPENCLDTVQFNDTNNKPLLGPMNGHDLYECIKHGGYAFQDDMKMSPIRVVTTGSGATGGTFTIIYNLPIEIVSRDGLGSLPNKSSSATFDLNLTLAASATIYSTAPTVAPSIRVRVQQYGWMDPNATDMRGNQVNQSPPGVQTTQYWMKQTYTLSAGQINQRLTGIDSMVRNLIFQLVDNANSRSVGDTDFPDPFTLLYETSIPVARLKSVWKHMIGEDFGYTATAETAGGRDNGVYPLPFNMDFTAKPGWETRLGYLPVSSSTTIAVSGTIGGSGVHTLTVFVNKIVPANGDPMVLTGR